MHGEIFPIRITTFNLRYGSAPDGAQRWARRKALVVERLRALDPDLLSLQECRDDAQARFLKRQLPEYEWLSVRRSLSDSPDLEMTPLLYRRASFQLLETGFFWLSETPSIIGSRSWGADFPRTVTWARLLTLASPPWELVFLSVHIDYATPEAQERSAALLRAFIDRLHPQQPVVLAGDFNAPKDSLPFHILTAPNAASPGLSDVFQRLHPPGEAAGAPDPPPARPPDGSFHAYGMLTDPPAIDWILISPQFNVLEARVETFQQDGIYPSDHYPVYARVCIASSEIRGLTFSFR
jgi:endonuclease/exonuclease/phosphatase family metal-dependent hydrolase